MRTSGTPPSVFTAPLASRSAIAASIVVLVTKIVGSMAPSVSSTRIYAAACALPSASTASAARRMNAWGGVPPGPVHPSNERRTMRR